MCMSWRSRCLPPLILTVPDFWFLLPMAEPEQTLQAQESCVEELEGLKQDFARRQQQEKAEHESELEQLRLYFEQRLREAERSYQEDLTLLQQRLQEGKVDSPLDAG